MRKGATISHSVHFMSGVIVLLTFACHVCRRNFKFLLV
ncbi:Hypothetical protein BSSP2_I1044 [Brucella suis bv. 2]|nr:hypothetical protein BM28_A1039 [Brucella melitensis M28]AIB17762.1 Hypothetical protein BSSP3_I1042 [Brucella suis bv. 2]AIB20785.1 Hypothetical protein BSPT1_I0686 [Brucella suis bv. 2]AIB27536.1 Hypothetical protein BSSP1_I0674 [Brucella suis bv. 2]AIB31264.1 Hypothetical protein BSSP2_I1044 [Brucella suis bv. 2]